MLYERHLFTCKKSVDCGGIMTKYVLVPLYFVPSRKKHSYSLGFTTLEVIINGNKTLANIVFACKTKAEFPQPEASGCNPVHY